MYIVCVMIYDYCMWAMLLSSVRVQYVCNYLSGMSTGLLPRSTGKWPFYSLPASFHRRLVLYSIRMGKYMYILM